MASYQRQVLPPSLLGTALGTTIPAVPIVPSEKVAEVFPFFGASLRSVQYFGHFGWQRSSEVIRDTEVDVAVAESDRKAERLERLRALKTKQLAHEQAAKSAQAAGDALYWPIYNLDLKNPHAKEGLEHADPKDLIASMRGHEAEVMRLLGEIDALVEQIQSEATA